MNAERRKHYPKNWQELARRCKEQAGKACEFCHITQGKKRKSKRTGEKYPVYLHAAHADHDIGNPNPRLICLCPTCHGKFDFRYRMKQLQITLLRMQHRKILLSVSH